MIQAREGSFRKAGTRYAGTHSTCTPEPQLLAEESDELLDRRERVAGIQVAADAAFEEQVKCGGHVQIQTRGGFAQSETPLRVEVRNVDFQPHPDQLANRGGTLNVLPFLDDGDGFQQVVRDAE